MRNLLSEEELEAIGSSEASSEATSCKICLVAQVTMTLQPCNHACVCAACMLRLRRYAARSPTAATEVLRCPVCRAAVQGCQRVYL